MRRASALLGLDLMLRRERAAHPLLGPLIVWVARSRAVGPLPSGLRLAAHPRRATAAQLALAAARRIAVWRAP